MIDVLFRRDGGRRPDVIVTDTGSYSDVVFGLVHLLGMYIDQALAQLRAEGYPLLAEDVARLSPYMRRHINVIGTYSFAPPDLGPTGTRPLRDPDEPDLDEYTL